MVVLVMVEIWFLRVWWRGSMLYLVQLVHMWFRDTGAPHLQVLPSCIEPCQVVPRGSEFVMSFHRSSLSLVGT